MLLLFFLNIKKVWIDHIFLCYIFNKKYKNKVGDNMIQYEKIELDYDLPIKLIDLYFEDHLTKTAKHWHNSIEILMPILGELKLHIDTREIIVKEGTFYIVNTQEIHGMAHTEETEIYKGYALQINYDFIKQNFSEIDNYYFMQPDFQTQHEVLKDIYHIILAYENENKFKDIEIKSYILHLLYILFAQALCKRKDYPFMIQSEHDKRIIRITKYIDEHYNEDLSIGQIADHFHISSGYLSKYFKISLNMTVKEYINSVRLKNARKDLLFSEYSIIEISYLHGFPNLKSFTQIFKKKYNCTPAKYRDKMRK